MLMKSSERSAALASKNALRWDDLSAASARRADGVLDSH